MCGIVGFINFDKTIEQDRKKWISNAILVDQLRGVDSTGIALLPKQYVNADVPVLRSYKKALAAADFLQLGAAQSILKDADNCKFVMGHNRFATQGDKSDDNFAHPFCYKEITAVHNGTLTDRTGLSHAHTVDSAAIAMQLGDIEPDKYASLLAELRGAYTLVWYNAANNHVYLARNDKRPLFLAKGYQGDTLFFASEEWMITWLMDRININALDLTDEGLNDIWEMPVDTLHSLDLGATDYNITTETYKGYVTPPITTNIYTGVSNYAHVNSQTPNQKSWDSRDYFDDGPFYGRGKTQQTKQLPAPDPKADCPYKVSETLFADEWEYITGANARRGGKIIGTSSDFPDVSFIIPNITNTKYKKLHNEWMEWKEALLEDEGTKGDIPVDLQEIYLTGEVTCTSNTKSKDKWVVNLKPKSLSIEFVMTPLEEQLEDIEDTEETTEKQPEARTSTNEATGSPPSSTGWKIGDKSVSWNEWLVAVARGCSYCTLSLYVKDHDTIVWKSYIEHEVEKLVPICGSCADFLFTVEDKKVGQ